MLSHDTPAFILCAPDVGSFKLLSAGPGIDCATTGSKNHVLASAERVHEGQTEARNTCVCVEACATCGHGGSGFLGTKARTGGRRGEIRDLSKCGSNEIVAWPTALINMSRSAEGISLQQTGSLQLHDCKHQFGAKRFPRSLLAGRAFSAHQRLTERNLRRGRLLPSSFPCYIWVSSRFGGGWLCFLESIPAIGDRI